jgi:hypothetical protein
MKKSFKIAFRLFKYLSIIFTVAFWIYMINDDYVFIQDGVDLEEIGMWFLWYLVYFMTFAFYFWVLSTVIILIYNKVIKRADT